MKTLHKRIMKVLFASILIFGIMKVSSSALNYHYYYFSFPASLSNNMQYSGLHQRDTGSAYVYPNVSTIGTIYFMSPHDYGYTQATVPITISQRTPGYFTWYSGYGGTGQWYCLAGCPDDDWWPWAAYNIGGPFYE